MTGVQREIDRISQNIQNTYAVLNALGADMPSVQNSDNLAQTAGSTKAVLYSAQSLTDAQKTQARENIGAVTPHIGDNGNWYIGDTDTGKPSVLTASGKIQYVKKSNITDGYFWWVNGGLPYKYKYNNYSVVEPITLPAGTYCLSAVSHAYSKVVDSSGTVKEITEYSSGATSSTGTFVLTLTETSTLYLAYYHPTGTAYDADQVTEYTPYVVNGSEPLADGEYFEGEDTLSLEKMLNYDIFDLAYIKNGALVANDRNVTSGQQGDYTGVKMGANVKKLMCKARFPASAYAKVALVTTKYGSSLIGDITRGSVHLVFGNNHCSVGVYKTADKLTELLGISYTIQENAEVSFGFEVDEATNTLTVYLPTGATRTVTDASISSLNGQYAIWEHYINTESAGEFAFCKMTKLWCKDINGEILDDNLKRLDGAIGVAPTGQVYRQFNSNSHEFS
jgi:hypothetical protein